MPKVNETMFVRVVIVIETAASDIVRAILSGTDCFNEVRRQAANITNVSSIPIPGNLKVLVILHNGKLWNISFTDYVLKYKEILNNIFFLYFLL